MNFCPDPDDVLIARRFKEYKEQFINKFFPENRSIKILDLGCGHGLFLHTCNRLGYTNSEGIDQSEELLEYGRREFKLKNLQKGDAETYLKTKPDNTYDVITAFNIIEHVRKEEVERLLQLIHSKLKPGGIFIMEVPNADSPLGIHTLYSDLTHELAFTRLILTRLFDIAGFKEIIILPKFVNANKIIRLGQIILAKIIGMDDKLMFTGNIIAVGYKK